MTTPDDFRHAPIRAGVGLRTFQPRKSPLGKRRQEALAQLWPELGFSVHDPALGSAPRRADGFLDTESLFGRHAPLVLEIGSGMGEATAAMAAADPGRDYLAVEAHLPGIASLLALIGDQQLTNVRVAHGDALVLVEDLLAPASLDAVHIFFSDPWPKSKHHKRRLVRDDVVALLATRLRPGAVLHCATDWVDYAEQMRTVLDGSDLLVGDPPGFSPRPAHRPVTKFEQRGLDLGHEVHDLVYRRR